jgi:hypothetical protein
MHSFRLYCVLRSLQQKEVNEVKTRNLSIYFLSLPVIYITCVFLLCLYLKVPFSLAAETCVSGSNASVPHSFFTLSLSLPNFCIPMIVALVSDLAIVAIHWKNSGKKNLLRNIIPLRATMFSYTTLLSLVLFVFLLLNYKMAEIIPVTVMLMTIMALIVVRGPVCTAVCLGFKSRKETKSRLSSREARLRRVIDIAKQEREMRGAYVLELAEFAV